MADALVQAPLKKEISIGEDKVIEGSPEHKVLTQTFDVEKKYMFQLAAENLEREMPVWDMRANRPMPHKKFKPFQNIVLTSQIVWNGQRRMLRYYDGCTTIFADQQPKDKDMIDVLIKQSKPRNFLEGKFGVYGDEKLLLLYMNICSWNAESPFKTRTSTAVFVPVNSDKNATRESDRIDQTENALKLSKEASVTKMMIHANYLGIPVIDYDSGNELTEKEVRAEYRKEALRNSANFIETYGNKSIEVRYYIEKALEKGIINNKFNPNKATWQKSNTAICDISGLKSPEAISQRIFEFSQTEEGAEFLIQLKAISE